MLVTQEDYEAVIRQIPGLGIHKVRAFAPEGGSGGIRVAVKPLSEEPYPHLPAVYARRAIQAEIEKEGCWLRGVILLDPVYVLNWM